MSETYSLRANKAQIEYWNTAAGETWADLYEQLDRHIEILGREAMRLLAPVQGERVLDIGCGCGQTSLELAAIVYPEGSIVGVDISKPMLEVARNRLRLLPDVRVEFLELDVQSDEFRQESFDAAFSRFGVMFFNDPLIAFTKIYSALKPGGRIGFVCWRSLEENLWMRIPLEAAMPFLPPVPPSDALAPGPFAFAKADRVRSILADAGFEAIEINPFDTLIGSGDIEQTLSLTFRVGPLGALLREHPEFTPQVAAAVQTKLAAYLTSKGVQMPAAVWQVQARKA